MNAQAKAGVGRYLLVKGTAGLGNRVLTLLTGIAYARLTSRSLIVDWSDPMFSDSGENAFPRLFECSAAAAWPPALESASVAPAIWNGRLRMTPMQLINQHDRKALGQYGSHRVASVDVGAPDREEQVVVMWAWDSQLHRFQSRLNGDMKELAAVSEFDALRMLANRYLGPSPAVRAAMASVPIEAGRAPFLGVHIRNTDRRAPIGRIHRAVDRVLSQHPEVSIFLATDQRAAEDEFRRRYRDVWVLEKSYTADGGPLHLDFAYGDRAGRAVHAVAEMFLLASCRFLVYARRSSFSYVAHLLSGLGRSDAEDVDRFNLVLHAKRLAQRHGGFFQLALGQRA